MIPVFLSITAIIVAVAAAKTVLFIKDIGDRKLAYWFFFPRYIVIPSSKFGRKRKELQNKLSTILFILFLSELLMWVILKAFQ